MNPVVARHSAQGMLRFRGKFTSFRVASHWSRLEYDARDSDTLEEFQRRHVRRMGSIGPSPRYTDRVGVGRVHEPRDLRPRQGCPHCPAVIRVLHGEEVRCIACDEPDHGAAG